MLRGLVSRFQSTLLGILLSSSTTPMPTPMYLRTCAGPIHWLGRGFLRFGSWCLDRGTYLISLAIP